MQIKTFAVKIAKDRSLVHKYLYEGVIPKPKAMAKIFALTLGAVTPNDFYNLYDIMFDRSIPKKPTNHLPKMQWSISQNNDISTKKRIY